MVVEIKKSSVPNKDLKKTKNRMKPIYSIDEADAAVNRPQDWVPLRGRPFMVHPGIVE